MAVIFDAIKKNILSTNSVNLKTISGSGKLIGFSTGKFNGIYSDMFDGAMTITVDANTINVLTKYTTIDNIVKEIIGYKYHTEFMFNPYESGMLNFFVMYDDGEEVPKTERVATRFIEYSITPYNTVDIPVMSGDNVIRDLIFTERDNDLLFTLNTGMYLFKDKPTSAIPNTHKDLQIPGDRIFITMENNTSESIKGVLVIVYGW